MSGLCLPLLSLTPPDFCLFFFAILLCLGTVSALGTLLADVNLSASEGFWSPDDMMRSFYSRQSC